MAYTKEYAIDQCYIRINNGNLSSENRVKREDIEPYLIAALAWVWGLESEDRLQTMMRTKRYGMADMVSFDDLRISQYITPQYDEKKKEYFVPIHNIPAIGGNHFFEVLPISGTKPIYRINKESDLSGLEDVVQDFIIAYYQNLKGVSPRIFLLGLKDADSEVEVLTNADFSTLANSDILPAPAGKELLIIDKTVEFFTGQKNAYEDNKIDQNDMQNQRNQ